MTSAGENIIITSFKYEYSCCEVKNDPVKILNICLVAMNKISIRKIQENNL